MKNPEVDALLATYPKWKEEILYLRKLALETGLEETVKWNCPTYMLDGTNVFIFGTFKDFFTINFFNGVLMNDSSNILTTHGDNQATSRVIKMTSVEQIKSLESIIKDYMKIAIDNEKAGLKPEKRNIEASIVYPQELLDVFIKRPEFKEAFEKLTPGRRRGYCIFFEAAKQSQTRLTRIEKYYDKIMDGKGMLD